VDKKIYLLLYLFAMTNRLLLFPAVFISICILSCNSENVRKDEDSSRRADSDSTGLNLLPNLLLPESKFIRTASLKSKVRSVTESVIEIENKTRSLGGYVSLSHFITYIQDSSEISVTQDSVLQVMHFGNNGYMILRVPDEMMDSLLTLLRPLSTVMLDREIRADNVGIQMLSNQMSDQRSQEIGHRLATDITLKGKKLTEIEQSEKTIDEKRRAGDEAKISNLNLEYAVEYSTISIEIYQDPLVRYSEIAKERKIVEYRPPFIYQMNESLSYGWQLLKDLIIDVGRYWVLFMSVILGFLLFTKHIRKEERAKKTNGKPGISI
jgi:hypothetical protein